MLELKYSTNIFTKQNIADYNAILNFDVNAAKRIYIKLVGISEKELFMPHNCLNKICMIEKNKELQLIVLFTDSLTRNKTRGLIYPVLLLMSTVLKYVQNYYSRLFTYFFLLSEGNKFSFKKIKN